MTQNDKQNDEFGFFTKQVHEVQQKPFKKLAFLGIAWGLGLGLSLGMVQFGINAYNQSAQKEVQIAAIHQQQISSEQTKMQQASEGQRNTVLNKIKKISPDNFKHFMNYLENEQNFYDTRVQLVTDSIIAAQAAERSTSLDGLGESQKLNNNLSIYKKNYEGLILKINNLYQSVQDNQTNQPIADLNSMVEIYNRFQAGLPIRNVEIEKQLNAYLFAKNKGNVSYNTSHQILEKEKALENDAINIIKSNKLKM
jgi:hypothetical protein